MLTNIGVLFAVFFVTSFLMRLIFSRTEMNEDAPNYQMVFVFAGYIMVLSIPIFLASAPTELLKLAGFSLKHEMVLPLNMDLLHSMENLLESPFTRKTALQGNS